MRSVLRARRRGLGASSRRARVMEKRLKLPLRSLSGPILLSKQPGHNLSYCPYSNPRTSTLRSLQLKCCCFMTRLVRWRRSTDSHDVPETSLTTRECTSLAGAKDSSGLNSGRRSHKSGTLVRICRRRHRKHATQRNEPQPFNTPTFRHTRASVPKRRCEALRCICRGSERHCHLRGGISIGHRSHIEVLRSAFVVVTASHWNDLGLGPDDANGRDECLKE